MKTRIFSGAILLLIVGSCMFISPLTRVLFFTVAGIVCAYELSKNFEKLDANCSLWVMVTYLLASAFMVLFGASVSALVSCFVGAVFLSLLAGILQEKVSGKGAFYTMGGVCYPCMLFVAAMVISKSELWLEALALGCVPSWMSDIFALVGGSKFGKHKLAPRVSPNKTVEGAVCGEMSGILSGVLLFYVFKLTGSSSVSITVCVITALLAAAMGQIGDLAESMLKRLMGVKDFSNLIPGHGGLFDRADALLFSVPTAYFVLKLTYYAI